MVSSGGRWEVNKEINNDLRNLIDDLDEIEDIDREFECEIVESDTLDVELLKKHLMEFWDRLNKIKLDIDYKSELVKKINEKVVAL